jgi:PAS domain S-box-containing protein
MPPARARTPAPKLAELRGRVAELERERELLNAIANWAPSLLCLVGADGRVRPLASNKAFERTLGYEPEEVGGVLFWERYVPPEDAPGVRAVIEEVIVGGTAEELAGRWLTRSGEPGADPPFRVRAPHPARRDGARGEREHGGTR